MLQYNKILFDSVNKVSSTDGDLRSHKPIFDRVLHILAREPQKPKPKLKEALNDILVRQVTYRHPDHDKPVLSDVNLSIGRGDRIVIYGRSGAGKSTLVKLLTGLLEPTEGEILVSGRNLKHLNKRFLYKKIGYIMQDPTLFDMTIREYLLLNRPKATEAEMIDACRKAQILDFIREQADGLDTRLGEGGCKLSGGQKQRIILAGVILKQPEMIVLDEATRHLDQQTEDFLYAALDKLAKDIIVIMITHRKSGVPFGNRFLHVHEGRVHERNALFAES